MKIAAVAALAIFLATSGLSAQAQQMPAELVGVWASDGVSCDLPDDDVDGEFPYLIVATNGYAGHEATCRLASAGPPIRQGSRTGYRLKFRCEGEGMDWRASEVWTVMSVRRRHGGWMLTQQRLIREGASYRRCGLGAAPSE
ncbi:hypothetical protein [Xanthobacter pseudotagetidis]|uniref:hypothetical protein n=1 Tax=Xanthobacter pseudotagetidis TaxID=3119911 RepID=UPI00372A1CC5